MAQEFTDYTITGPDGTVAVLGPTRSLTNWVGYLTGDGVTGLDSPEVREAGDVLPEGDGGVHANFFYGRRPFSFEGMFPSDVNGTTLNGFLDKLNRATNALRADGNVKWTETGSVEKILFFRRQQPVRFTQRRPRTLQVQLVSANHRIQSSALHSSGPSTLLTVSNAGNIGATPSFSIASPGATVTISNTTTGESLTFTGLSGGGTVTLDFAAHTIVQGGINKASAISWPSSKWWELQPGSNSITVTNAATITWRDAWL